MSSLQLNRCLLGIVEVKYKLENETGLIIRYPLARARIGGADVMPMALHKKYVIDNNVVELEVPYIPGSSLKGRMRGLLELKENVDLFNIDGKITQHFLPPPQRFKEEARKFIEKYLAGDSLKSYIDHVFGYSALHLSDLEEVLKEVEGEKAKSKASNMFKKLAITRLIVYDAYPSQDYVAEKYREKQRQGLTLLLDDFLEDKPENRIDRVTSAADPRLILRIKPGIEFEGLMKILLFDVDKGHVKDILKLVFAGMKLVEDTYLGGSGSRGYGKVRFKDIELVLKPRNYYDTGSGVENVGRYATVEELLRNVDNIAKTIESKLEERKET